MDLTDSLSRICATSLTNQISLGCALFLKHNAICVHLKVYFEHPIVSPSTVKVTIIQRPYQHLGSVALHRLRLQLSHRVEPLGGFPSRVPSPTATASASFRTKKAQAWTGLYLGGRVTEGVRAGAWHGSLEGRGDSRHHMLQEQWD